MKARALGFACVLLVLVGQAWAQPVAPAKPAHPDQVSVTAQRLAILDFEYDPDEGNLVVRGTDVDGVKPYALDALSIAAIGDEIERGRTIRAELAQVNASTFRGTLNLSEGTWNLVVRANQGEQRLEGQYQLGVGKSVVTGRVPLVPPNPEVGRLTWIVGLMFGVPLGIALVLVVGIVVVRQLRGAPRASA